jgi:signal transduction histidine kinase
MDNAIKFTPIGQQITLVLSNGEDGVYVTVDNATSGVSELQLENLLKENNHLSTRGTAKESGVGLGLLLAREYISANKGVLKVRVEGHHVIFYFNLPALVEK